MEDDDVLITAEYELSEAEVIRPNEQGRQAAQAEKLKAAIAKARDLVWCKMYESGAPGMVVAISVNGKQVWQHGFGYSDLENKLLMGTIWLYLEDWQYQQANHHGCAGKIMGRRKSRPG